MKERTLALSAVFQSGELVRQAANHGTWSGYAAGAMLHSLFTIESRSVQEIYGNLDRMRLGMEVLLSVLQGDKSHLESLQYAIAILKLQRRFSRNSGLQETVGARLREIARMQAEPGIEPHELEDRQAAELAQLYSRTISTLSPRIIVHGKPRHLQAERNVHWIRTLLFAGLRSAHLWEQLGGSRWRLMFGRQQLLREAEELIAG